MAQFTANSNTPKKFKPYYWLWIRTKHWNNMNSVVVISEFTKKSRIRETSNLSTDADCRTDTILERLSDLSTNKKYYIIFF